MRKANHRENAGAAAAAAAACLPAWSQCACGERAPADGCLSNKVMPARFLPLLMQWLAWRQGLTGFDTLSAWTVVPPRVRCSCREQPRGPGCLHRPAPVHAHHDWVRPCRRRHLPCVPCRPIVRGSLPRRGARAAAQPLHRLHTAAGRAPLLLLLPLRAVFRTMVQLQG